MISIIIPTLNEEKLLPRLLKDIKDQTFEDYEVIIADAHSTDKTRQIAKEFGCKVVDGGMPGPGRNRGVEAAEGQYLMFFDADVTIPNDFLEKVFDEFQDRYLDIAATEVYPDNLEKSKYVVMYEIYNAYIHYAQFVNPGALGFSIFMTKRLFERIGGFDESIKVGEDYDLVKRATKLGKFRILDSTSVFVSVRRMEKEGMFKFITFSIRSELHRLFVGEITDDRFKYRFAHYDEEDKKESKKFLKKLRASLKKAKGKKLFDSK
jgi:glycosyltransferase involved in cell wall biosynthesis